MNIPGISRATIRLRAWLRSAATRVGAAGTTGAPKIVPTTVLMSMMAAGAVTMASCSTGQVLPKVEPTVAPAMGSGPGLAPLARDLYAYAGLGTWVDVFDYAPAYTGGQPSVTPDEVDRMADRGVRVLYLQAARWDSKSPKGIVDRELVRRFLARAHGRGMHVVGWYLPALDDLDRDVDRMRRIRDFSVAGQSFDGIAIDIEYTEGVPDAGQRSARLVDLSRRYRSEAGSIPLGAIVLPAVQLDVVNKRYWPDFPYSEIAGLYDVWLPMAYWTFRLAPYDDGYRYVKESVDLLRDHLGRPDALVAPVGGIADRAKDEHVQQFARALVDVSAIGGSFYDWGTLPISRQVLVQHEFAVGLARALPAPPR